VPPKMTDINRTHNSSPMPGVVPNPDPALDIAKEHQHPHLHHGAHAEKGHTEHDHMAYTTGTTKEPHIIPDASPLDDQLHRRHHPERHAGHDIEKSGGLAYDEEKGSMSKPRSSDDPVVEVDSQRHLVSKFYATYRMFFHLFIGLFFTG
jgi:concentrative nucleoside transporter, CNT family